MEKYLQQLTQELRAAHDRQPPRVDYRLFYPEYSHLPDELAYIAEWEQAPLRTLPDLFGIAAEQFPPDDRLTDQQCADLLDEILKLWQKWSIYTIFPDQAPARLCYRVITDIWREETMSWSSEGNMTIGMCTYHIPSCPWGREYCTCSEQDEDE